MIRSSENQGEKKRAQPFCQATGCFDYADFYVVVKETEEPNYYQVSKEQDYEKLEEKGFDGELELQDFDGFKLILYLCHRHENDFKYLIRGSELRISRKCELAAPELR